jgi:hypothetical protein
MSVFDTWFTGLQTAATTLGGIVMGGVTGALIVWRNVSKTQNAVAKDLGEIAWIKDQRENGRVEAQLEGALQQLQDLANNREKHYHACEERVLVLSAQLLDVKLFAGKVYKELAVRDAEVAERLMRDHLEAQRLHRGEPS